MQPDSFFGASGGQRIDTRDASGQSSSSMSYSLSQLDAIGDVDPVAEADVYLAYGRDLQAEEILKEAMRTNPDRLAIRTKLLEVYAKRRDTKGFELLASQLHSLTKGQGDDWAKAQELGAQIDADNPLYKPGGKPVAVTVGAGGALVSEPLSATTQHQSTQQITRANYDISDMGSTTSSLGLGPDVTSPSVRPGLKDEPKGIDPRLLDTQPIVPTTPTPKSPAASALAGVAAAAGGAAAAAGGASAAAAAAKAKISAALPELMLPTGDALAASTTQSMEFDLTGLNFDAPSKAAASSRGPISTSGADPMFAKSTTDAPADLGLPSSFETGDPLTRKLELAEEFRQIGDVDGARDLLEEVIAKAKGDVKAKAQGMLDRLA
jgi:pilus assembly protein FimV